MKEEITDSIKREATTGILQIIGKIFSTLIEPLLNGIEALKGLISDFYKERRIRRTMGFILFSDLMMDYISEHNIDILVFSTHNGEHSESGYDFRFVKALYSSFISEKNAVNKFLAHSTPAHFYLDWLSNCVKCKETERVNYNSKEKTFFGNYERIYWRRFHDIFYCVLANKDLDINQIEQEINEIIRNL